MTGDSPSTAAEAWGQLSEPWQTAFTEAWTSFTSGNFGIGAVLIDPADGSLVSAGRNRVGQSEREPGLLSGNMTAHAEMNTFAMLDRFNAEGLHLYTTLEPCLMCMATSMLLKVSHIHMAADDEFFDGMTEQLWPSYPLTAERAPDITRPFTGPLQPLAQFARLLPLVFTLEHLSGRNADRLARAAHPELSTLADELRADGWIHDHAALDIEGALVDLWPRLKEI